MFVLKIRLIRCVFELLKPGEKFLRSAFFVGSGKRKDGFLKLFLILFFLRVSFPGAGTRICRFLRVAGLLGVAGLLHARTLLRVASMVASAGAGILGWSENNFDGPVHDLQNSLVVGVAGNVLGNAGIVAASARRGENDVGGHPLEFENSVCVRLAEPVCMNSFGGNSLNSVTCHPSMLAPSLARVIDGKSDGLVGWSVVRGLEEG